jgi:PAS domain S-box-containing protein
MSSHIADNPAFGLHALGSDGTFLRISKTELSWLGYTEQEVVGKMRFEDLLTEADKIRFRQRFPRFIESGVAVDVEYNLLNKDGSVLPVSINGTAVRDCEGNFLHTVAIVVNLTARKQADSDAKRLALLERTQDLVRLLAHDLRNPLVASNRFLRLLQEGFMGSVTEEQRQVFKTMQSSNELIMNKISLLQEIHQYEGRDRNSNESPKVPLSTVLEDCLCAVAESDTFQSKQLGMDLDLNQSSMIKVEQRAMSLLVMHLVENVASWSRPNRKINIFCQKSDGYFELQVSGHGYNQPAKNLDGLFDRIWSENSDPAATQDRGSAGSLFLCAKIVEALNGTIACTNLPEHGACFSVRFKDRS